jgi:hypothetical protein
LGICDWLSCLPGRLAYIPSGDVPHCGEGLRFGE